MSEIEHKSHADKSNSDSNELVHCRLTCYGVKHGKQSGFGLQLILSVLVGPKGLKLPLDADFLQEVPIALIGKIRDDSGMEVLEPVVGNKYDFEMPRWLAEKKGFTIND